VRCACIAEIPTNQLEESEVIKNDFNFPSCCNVYENFLLLASKKALFDSIGRYYKQVLTDNWLLSDFSVFFFDVVAEIVRHLSKQIIEADT